MNYMIDRFEGKMAVLERENRTFIDVPREKLPSMAEEGSKICEKNGVYTLVDNTAQRERIKKKMESLFEE